MDQFKKFFQDIDLLLLDHFEDFVNKYETQKQLSKFIDFYEKHRKKIVITADNHPAKWAGVDKRLKNQLLAGLLVELKAIQPDAMKRFVFQRAESMGMKLDDEMVEYICQTRANLYEIEGILQSLYAYSQIMGQKVNIDLVRNVCKPFETSDSDKEEQIDEETIQGDA